MMDISHASPFQISLRLLSGCQGRAWITKKNGKRTSDNGQPTTFEDVSPINNGDIPASHVSFQGCTFLNFRDTLNLQASRISEHLSGPKLLYAVGVKARQKLGFLLKAKLLLSYIENSPNKRG